MIFKNITPAVNQPLIVTVNVYPANNIPDRSVSAIKLNTQEIKVSQFLDLFLISCFVVLIKHVAPPPHASLLRFVPGSLNIQRSIFISFHRVRLLSVPRRPSVCAQSAELHGLLGLQRRRAGLRLARRPPGLLCRAPARRGRVLLLAMHPRLALRRPGGVRKKSVPACHRACLSLPEVRGQEKADVRISQRGESGK